MKLNLSGKNFKTSWAGGLAAIFGGLAQMDSPYKGLYAALASFFTWLGFFFAKDATHPSETPKNEENVP